MITTNIDRQQLMLKAERADLVNSPYVPEFKSLMNDLGGAYMELARRHSGFPRWVAAVERAGSPEAAVQALRVELNHIRELMEIIKRTDAELAASKQRLHEVLKPVNGDLLARSFELKRRREYLERLIASAQPLSGEIQAMHDELAEIPILVAKNTQLLGSFVAQVRQAFPAPAGE